MGRPAYSNGRKPAVRKLPLARPVLGAEEADAAGAALASGWVMQGPQVAAFEREFALAVGAKFACAVSSGTTALHLALLAAGVKPGDEVVTASHSFIATANAIRYCGAKPVFCDIEPGTFNLEPKRLKALLTDRTRAVLAVHQMGMPCDLKSILKITRPLGLPVVEDAACAIGSELNWEGRWERVGRPRGDISCFSFHPRKILTTGDGGMLTTANADFDAQFRLWRNHGSAGESYPALGYNYRLTDIQAAVGREQLKRLDGLVRRRRTLAARYRELLAPIKGLGLPVEPDWARSNWQSFCVRLPSRISREKAQDALKSKGADSKPGIMCAHLEPAYAKEPWSCGKDGLKESELAHERGLILPLFDGMTDADLQLVAKTLHETLDKA
ncbi:MAG: DegT/DnrJ/EryC1/StrS family aminotransferase [Elusimicrobia bacterium]|nr:DegT/DnrJ/EryC1/StrS family aminotransferase [Elusimicrobiota bacterium]